jgi:hypothetical protein
LKWFHRWCVNENPSIPGDITPPALLDLGIFAAKYQVFALEHQVTDKFHEKLHDRSSRDQWVLRADKVTRAYRQCPQSACVRRVFCVALNSLSPRQLLDEWDEWSQLAAMGGEEALLDLLKAMTKAVIELSSTQARMAYYRSMHSSDEPCKFHDHLRQDLVLAETEGIFGGFFKRECPYVKMECFPDKIVVRENLAAVEDGEAATALDKRPAAAVTKEEIAMILEEALASAEVEEVSCDGPVAEEAVPSGDEPAVEETAASCDDPPTSPAEETLAADETSGVYDVPQAEPVALCDKPAAAEPGPDECINPWEALKKPKKDKKKKRDPSWYEEAPMEEAPAPPGPKSKKDKKKKGHPISDEEQPVEEAAVDGTAMEEAPAPPGPKSKKDKKKKRHPISDEEPPVEEGPVEEAAVDGTAIEDAPAPPAPVEDESDEWERLTRADRALG